MVISKHFQGIQLQDLPPITAEKLDVVSGMYPKHTTVGSDGFHPRVIQQLSRTAKSLIVAMLMASERLESWVGVIDVLNAVLKRLVDTGYWVCSLQDTGGGLVFDSSRWLSGGITILTGLSGQGKENLAPG